MSDEKPSKMLFWGCFIALIATAFGFIVRAFIIGDWGTEFGLSATQQGEIFGVGLWPFAVSIVAFSLIIDKVGYKFAMIFGFVCHVLSAIITISAKGYWGLWIGTFIVALGNGTVEAYINPVVATMFSKEKTKWLNILHAGWPGGLVLGGLIALLILGDASWQLKVGLILIPTVLYFVMLIGQKFPVNERVAAGVSYIDMLREVGGAGVTIIAWMIVAEVGRVLGDLFGFGETLANLPINWIWMALIIGAAVGLIFGLAVRSVGRPMFIILLLIMIPLATTELGTDSWVTELMQPIMKGNGGYVLIYTSLIMAVLRFCAGPIVHRLSPLGLLAASSAIAAIGLIALSSASAAGMVFLAATVYGVGKTFFWPTMLGVVSEQFPKGGALTLNATGAVGMLGVGVLGAQFLGFFQDKTVDDDLLAKSPEIHQQVLGEKQGLFGPYKAVVGEKVETLSDEQKEIVTGIQDGSKQTTLKTVAIFPIIMLVCYIGLIFYFRKKGGYKAEVLTGHGANDGEFTGGVEGPAEM